MKKLLKISPYITKGFVLASFLHLDFNKGNLVSFCEENLDNFRWKINWEIQAMRLKGSKHL